MSSENSRKEYQEELRGLPHYESKEKREDAEIFVMFKPDFMRNFSINFDKNNQEVAFEVEGSEISA